MVTTGLGGSARERRSQVSFPAVWLIITLLPVIHGCYCYHGMMVSLQLLDGHITALSDNALLSVHTLTGRPLRKLNELRSLRMCE